MKLGRTIGVLVVAFVVAACVGTAVPSSAATSMEAVNLVLGPNLTAPFGGNLQLGNLMPDSNVAALIIDNGTGQAVDNGGTTQNIFAYTPSSLAGSFVIGGTTYVGITAGPTLDPTLAVRKAAFDGYTANWNYQPMSSGGTSGLYAGAGNKSTPISLGYMTSAEYTSQPSHPTTFGGVQMSVAGTNSIVVRETYSGDTTLKGYVNLTDFSNWGAGYSVYLNTGGATPTDWSQGDFNYDGKTDLTDFGIWGAGYSAYLNGHSVVGPAGEMGGGGAMPAGGIKATPEPASIVLLVAGLLGVGGLGFLAQRRGTRARG